MADPDRAGDRAQSVVNRERRARGVDGARWRARRDRREQGLEDDLRRYAGSREPAAHRTGDGVPPDARREAAAGHGREPRRGAAARGRGLAQRAFAAEPQAQSRKRPGHDEDLGRDRSRRAPDEARFALRRGAEGDRTPCPPISARLPPMRGAGRSWKRRAPASRRCRSKSPRRFPPISASHWGSTVSMAIDLKIDRRGLFHGAFAALHRRFARAVAAWRARGPAMAGCLAPHRGAHRRRSMAALFSATRACAASRFRRALMRRC